MGEKATLRLALADAEERATEERFKRANAEAEVRRVRSDNQTLGHRLEAAYTEVRNRRAFQAAVAKLDGIVTQLKLLPDDTELTDTETWFNPDADPSRIVLLPNHPDPSVITCQVAALRSLLERAGYTRQET